MTARVDPVTAEVVGNALIALAEGVGPSKKEAEQESARLALERLRSS